MTAEALDDFCNALSSLLDDLAGSVTLEPTLGSEGHGDFSLTIRLDHGKGDIEGFFATHFHAARLGFAGYEIDQSDLQETRRQLRSLLADR